MDVTLFNLEGIRLGGIAQLEEHLLCKQGVIGSSPIISTKNSRNQIKTQRSGFDLERRSGEASEFSPKVKANDTEPATTRAHSSAG